MNALGALEFVGVPDGTIFVASVPTSFRRPNPRRKIILTSFFSILVALGLLTLAFSFNHSFEMWTLVHIGSLSVSVKSLTTLIPLSSTLLFAGLAPDGEGNPQQHAMRLSEEAYRTLVSQVKDYAIFMLDPEGRVMSWNEGAERIKGYKPEEVVGRHFSIFYTPSDLADDRPRKELVVATREGRFEDEGWRVRKDGSRFWANVVITVLKDNTGRVCGFGKVTRDLSERKRVEDGIRRLNEELAHRTAELEATNKELEAFAYSVSHDLRAPLRAIDGFSQILLEDYMESLDADGQENLQRVRAATQRMGELIDGLLSLARLTRREMQRETVDLSALANSVAQSLRQSDPARKVDFAIAEGMTTHGDRHLWEVALQNLLENAWKFTGNQPHAQIEFGKREENGKDTFFVRDNGAGFDMAYAGKLFGAFQRLHTRGEFEGHGIGLATVQRIVHRHGGRIWAEGAVGRGATFSFTV